MNVHTPSFPAGAIRGQLSNLEARAAPPPTAVGEGRGDPASRVKPSQHVDVQGCPAAVASSGR